MLRALALLVLCGFAVALLVTIPHLAGGAGALVPAATEVVAASGVLSNGQTIPLPIYGDGTTASEDDCTWTVSVNTLSGNNEALQDLHCSADANRVVTCTGIDIDERPLSGQANYMIIAVRPVEPTAARRTTWGGLKSRFARLQP
jgi:hypothetical protein